MVQFSAFICMFSTILLVMKIGPGFWSRARALVPASIPSPKPDFIPNFVTKLLIGYMQMNDMPREAIPETIQASL